MFSNSTARLVKRSLGTMVMLIALASLCFSQSSYKGFPAGNCTNYAAQKFDSFAPAPKLNWHGNAGEWFQNAKNAHWRVSAGPYDARPQSIIVWTGGGAGHVGWVEQVANGRILVSEMNWVGFGIVSSTWLPLSNLTRGKTSQYRFAGYIFPTQFVGPLRP